MPFALTVLTIAGVLLGAAMFFFFAVGFIAMTLEVILGIDVEHLVKEKMAIRRARPPKAKVHRIRPTRRKAKSLSAIEDLYRFKQQRRVEEAQMWQDRYDELDPPPAILRTPYTNTTTGITWGHRR